MRSLTDVDLNLLVALGAALEERNLTRAGQRIGLTPPAMSGALARLRRLLDDELLIREGRGYVLSPLAESLLPTVQDALARAEHTLNAARVFAPATSTRTFAISISDYALTILSEPLERLLAARAPGVSIVFDSIPVAKQAQLLRRDLVIADVRMGMPGRRRAIFTDEFVCVVRAGHPRVTGDELSLDELAKLPYAAGSLGDGSPTPADLALTAEGVEPHVVLRCAGLLALPFIVSRSDVFTFLPERLAVTSAERLGVRIVRTPLRIAPLVEAVHWHPSNSEEAGLQWLLGLLREISRGLRRLEDADAPEPPDPVEE